MPIRKHTPPDPYCQAAEVILDSIEQEFGIRPKKGREATITALVNIMKHFLEKKSK